MFSRVLCCLGGPGGSGASEQHAQEGRDPGRAWTGALGAGHQHRRPPQLPATAAKTGHHGDDVLTHVYVLQQTRQLGKDLILSLNPRGGNKHTLECLTLFIPQHKAFAEVFLDDSRTPANCHVSLTVNAPVLSLVVRFPIPDLRSDQERGPWFKKSLQKEVLYLELEDLEVKTEFTGGSCPEQTKMELTFRELVGMSH